MCDMFTSESKLPSLEDDSLRGQGYEGARVRVKIILISL
jgi:hypothetical protein